MENTTLKQKTAKGLFWGAASNLIVQTVGLIYGIILARSLTAEDYGIVALITVFTAMAVTLANCGFSVALINKNDVTSKDYNAAFWFAIMMSVILYAIAFISAPAIANFYNVPQLNALTKVYCLTFIFSGASLVSNTIILKQIKVKLVAIIEIISLTIACFVGIYLIIDGHRNSWTIIIPMLVQVAASSVLKIIAAKWKPAMDFDLSPLKPMISFSVKIVLTSIFSNIYAYILPLLLGKFYDIKDVGNYNQGQKWSTMGFTVISTMIGYVTQPVLAQIGDSKERQINALRKLIRFGAFTSFPLMLGFAFAGEEFILLSIGEKWLPAVPFLQIFCAGNAFMFLLPLFSNMIFAQGKSGVHMKATILTGVIQIASVAAMYPLGIIPMVAAYTIMSVAGLIIWHYYVNRLVNLPLRAVLNDIIPYLAVTVCCIAVAWLLTKNMTNVYLLFFSKILITGVLYIFALKIFKSVIFKESMEFLIKK
ncbi:MAG: lipopolysaccharide biosynthesis protein [Dysgonamonadaceae bacterium]|jgi:O-antigen/teichoic acid export membrane protein|nr:lipopolysaccharide biosynthesis protein [Dysgonamonadaceae bacterium]